MLKCNSRSQKSRSVFQTIMIPLLLLVFLEVLLLVTSIHTSGVIQRLNRNSEDILEKQVVNRRDYLEGEMVGRWSELSMLAESINQTTQQMLNEGTLDLSALDSSSDACAPLLLNISDELITTMYSKRVSGIFVVFNTHDLSTEKQTSGYPSKPGIYIRDLDPSSTPSIRNADLLLERAPIAVVRNLNISTDAAWHPLFEFGPDKQSGYYDFLSKPFQAAHDAEDFSSAVDYGYWSASPFALQGDVQAAISYSIPLVLADGTVYGVLGIDLLTDYLRSMLPYSELFAEKQGSYLIAVEQNNDLCFTPTLINGSVLRQSSIDTIQITHTPEDGHTFVLDGKTYYAAVEYLSLYNSNTPFVENRWALIGAVQQNKLHAFSNQVDRTLLFVIIFTLCAGALGSLMVSRRLSLPIRTLADEVDRAQHSRGSIPHLPVTGISEIDRFSQEITALSRDVLDSSTRFLKIMEMASVELGGFEVRENENDVFVTENFFTLFDRHGIDPNHLTCQEFWKRMEDVYLDFEATPNEDGSFLYCVPLKQGGCRYLRVEITRAENRYVGLVEDVTVSTVERLRIEHERDYDLLTGLYNRRAFYRKLEEAFCDPTQLGHAALLLLDLDNLKSTNDRFGHDWGDQYIRKAGQCFAGALPKRALCARVSGDEFLILLAGYPNRDEIRAAISALSDAIHQSDFPLPNGEPSQISASGGVAWYPEDSTDYNELIRFADFAMYQVKNTQKGELGDFDLGTYNQESFLLQSKREFKQLLEQELLTYHFQPIFDAKTGNPRAYEALMRVDMPTLRSPDSVLSLARREGKLREIERLTWFLSCEAYQSLLDQHLVDPHAMLFVNSIASQQLTSEECQALKTRFDSLLACTVIEITESEDLDLEATYAKRESLGSSGLFALDDYGSGYNSEKNLLDLSPHFIKVDISIVRGIDTDPNKQQIVSNIVNYAHQRGMQIIAEGLENAAEIQMVLSLGVDLLQGYYLARPAPVPPEISRAARILITDFWLSQGES